ncbi:hypothetical protein HJFPF1_13651 [Paramyrothecium foliicola]|nr:hypothetical protein HJFPF1_13651 [Paramyrothecium foliicola]
MFNNSQGNRVGPKPTRQSRGDLRGQSADLDMSWLNTRLSSPQDNSTLDFDNLMLQQRDTKLKELEKVIQEMREFIKQSMGTMPPPEADPLDAALSF